MEASTAKKVLVFAAFVVAYGLAVFFAFTGCAVFFGQQLASLLLSGFPTYSFVVLTFPLLLIFSLNVLWHAKSYESITRNRWRIVLTIVVGIVLPLLILTLPLFLLSSAWSASYGYFATLLAVAIYTSISLFVYLITITSLAAEKPIQFASDLLLKPKFWATFILLLSLLVLSLFPVIDAQTLEGLLPQPYDEILRRSIVSGLFALPVAVVLPLFPWASEYFGSRHNIRYFFKENQSPI